MQGTALMQEFDTRRAVMDLVTAFVSKNKLKPAELPTLLTQVFDAISGFEPKGAPTTQSETVAPESGEALAPATGEASETTLAEPEPPLPAPTPAPAVSIEESISNPDFIISLITGEKFRTLKRHLRGNGLTEGEYRQRYNLPSDYPLVAPSYSEMRRNVARRMGLGRGRGGVKTNVSESPQPQVSGVEAAASPSGKMTAAKALNASRGKAGPQKAREMKSRGMKSIAPGREAASNPINQASPWSEPSPPDMAIAPPKVDSSAGNGTAEKPLATIKRPKELKKRTTAIESKAGTKARLVTGTPVNSAVPAPKKKRRRGGMIAEATKASGQPSLDEANSTPRAKKPRRTTLSAVFR
jgi:predicted transcriptional regulator